MEDQEIDENGSKAVERNYNSQVVVIDKYSLHSVSIPNKFAKQHLPPIASGKSILLEFEDCDGNKLLMEVVHSNYGDYLYLRTGWERYKDQHKLESGDFISFSKINDSYLIYSWKAEELDMQLHNESIERVQVLFKNLCAKDPKCLRLSKQEVEGNLDQHLIIEVGEEVILRLHDPIRNNSFTVQLLHADQEEYHIRGMGWEEYVAQHNLFIFDKTTIFVNKVILDPTAEVQLVNISYHYEITYQTRATNQPQKKLKLSGTSSAPASTAADNNS